MDREIKFESGFLRVGCPSCFTPWALYLWMKEQLGPYFQEAVFESL